MYLGFDTSNYTSSVALFDGVHMYQAKQLLSVRAGECGLRQSDAIFQHTVNIPLLVNSLDCNIKRLKAVGVSTRPRNIDGSYMPCFLVGRSNAVSVSRFTGAGLYETSHQVGHILAALYSLRRLDLTDKAFIAFHVSGGTTEALLVQPDRDEQINASAIAQSTDLKAGQAIDRAGVMLGLDFPCGRALDVLSQKSVREFKIKPSMLGLDCSLSGIENKARDMYKKGDAPEDIAKFVLSSVSSAIDRMTEGLLEKYGDLPLVYAGGVMSNTLIKNNILKKYKHAFFADPAYSCDNASGAAIYAYLKDRNE